MSVRSCTYIPFCRVYSWGMLKTEPMKFDSRKDKSIASFFSDGVTEMYSSGDTIVAGSDEPLGVYLIVRGFVKSNSSSHDGHANLLLMHGAGEFIPLPWALDGFHMTGLSYEAMSDVVVRRSSKDKLRVAMGNNMWLTQEILNQMVDIVAIYTQRIQILQYRSARGRIIAEMLYFADRFGRPDGEGVLIHAPITHQDVADSINMNRETASRALELLFQEGLMGQRDHLFVIPRLSKLREALR
jgi:CRP/FNR family cyclic AMP-dependent transcriptional regulator